MTTGMRRRRLSDIHRFYGGNKGSLCLGTKIFRRQMKEPDFRDYHLLLDEQADVGATARLAEHAEPAGSEYAQKLAAKDDDKARGPASGTACTTKVQFSANYPGGTVLQVRHRNDPCLSIEISIGAPP